MREVIQLQIGPWGINISQQFWEKVINEHNIDKDGHYIGDQVHAATSSDGKPI